MATRRGARTTLMDLARATGLSHMTVQRALLGNPSVRPETRTTVLEAAGRLGYRANASARAMRKGRSGHIGLLLPPPADGSADPSAALIGGIDAVLAERDLHLLPTLLPAARGPSGTRMPRLVEQAVIDGLLIADGQVPPVVIDHLERFRIPRIWINIDRSHDCVLSDARGLGRDATARLIALGHRRIVFLHEGEDSWESAGQHHGYGVAMQTAGLAATYHEEAGEPASWQARVAELLRDDASVSAVVVSVSEAALWHVVQGIRASGRVIQVVSLAARLPGYLGLEASHYRLDQTAMGSAVARALLRKMDAPDQPLAPVLVPFTWVDPGATLAPPPR